MEGRKGHDNKQTNKQKNGETQNVCIKYKLERTTMSINNMTEVVRFKILVFRANKKK